MPTETQPITLEQYKSVCSRFFPRTPIIPAHVTDILSDRVFYDCKPSKSLWVRFCPEDKYQDNHVIIFGEDWNVYTYTETGLASELEVIVPNTIMQAEKYPHAVGSVSPDHAGKTIDLCPYGDEGEDDGSPNPYGPVFGMDD